MDKKNFIKADLPQPQKSGCSLSRNINLVHRCSRTANAKLSFSQNRALPKMIRDKHAVAIVRCYLHTMRRRLLSHHYAPDLFTT